MKGDFVTLYKIQYQNRVLNGSDKKCTYNSANHVTDVHMLSVLSIIIRLNLCIQGGLFEPIMANSSLCS